MITNLQELVTVWSDCFVCGLKPGMTSDVVLYRMDWRPTRLLRCDIRDGDLSIYNTRDTGSFHPATNTFAVSGQHMECPRRDDVRGSQNKQPLRELEFCMALRDPMATLIRLCTYWSARWGRMQRWPKPTFWQLHGDNRRTSVCSLHRSTISLQKRMRKICTDRLSKR